MTTHPTALAAWVQSHPRNHTIDGHGFKLNIGKWNGMAAQLPGTPLLGEDGGTEIGLISRGGLFGLAAAAREDESGVAALHLFWQSLAWGTGTNHRNTPGRIASINAAPIRAASLLRNAAQLAVHDPKAAFLLLQPGRYPALKSWGPNFFTKYLYFAGAGAVGHPSLIVDARVLATLFKETGKPVFQPRSTNYPVGTYLAAIEVMKAWAAELSSAERTVGADEVERWAFGAGEGWRKRQAP
ncbi:hypothetical protein ACFVYC_21005 [Pseudarthrobacter sp. NPDC058329]|uniref:8-oxoguanine DNA glycosylase OGG fold protein n=1 Tax=Pseudarthrobacter sp. NPDC058329 TaxID=3346448 RepID=UPI0036DAAF0A